MSSSLSPLQPATFFPKPNAKKSTIDEDRLFEQRVEALRQQHKQEDYPTFVRFPNVPKGYSYDPISKTHFVLAKASQKPTSRQMFDSGAAPPHWWRKEVLPYPYYHSKVQYQLQDKDGSIRNVDAQEFGGDPAAWIIPYASTSAAVVLYWRKLWTMISVILCSQHTSEMVEDALKIVHKGARTCVRNVLDTICKDNNVASPLQGAINLSPAVIQSPRGLQHGFLLSGRATDLLEPFVNAIIDNLKGCNGIEGSGFAVYWHDGVAAELLAVSQGDEDPSDGYGIGSDAEDTKAAKFTPFNLSALPDMDEEDEGCIPSKCLGRL
eukprot:TRINITY_DN114434_c0_g1_i1.p1 TRINITY_DN114434_c0_g1~~TRINITY_DN114434_c0_g1_i1.p1  ORF type:complete len:322 (+),score=14.90 TRINITY_DN114434_c0_g1_i1:44-1009(+)